MLVQVGSLCVCVRACVRACVAMTSLVVEHTADLG